MILFLILFGTRIAKICQLGSDLSVIWGKIIFEDKIDYSFESQDTFYKGPHGYAMKGIQGANQKVISKLIEILE